MHYFNVTLSDIEYCCNSNQLIESSIRSDNNPSMGFIKRPDDKLVCRDFGGYFWGDCFDAAAFKLNYDITNGHQFMLTLEHIAKSFKIHKYSKDRTQNVITKHNIISSIKTKEKLQIQCQFRDWNKYDADYWYTKYCIDRSILSKYNVYPIKTLWINKKIIYAYRTDDPAYGYYFGQRDGIDEWKIYFPYRKEYRFLTNCKTVQGVQQIEENEIGVITKSFKDVMQLAVFGINSIAPPSEAIILTKEQMDYLRTKWKYIFTFSDFDYTGVSFACQMRRKYSTIPIFLTTGELGTIDFGAKDISDYTDIYGYEQANELVQKYLEVGEELIYNINFLKKLGHV